MKRFLFNSGVGCLQELKLWRSLNFYFISCRQKTIYKIKLPGQPILGEGKAENQNHAMIFTRGDALQAIDMNQVSV